MLLRSGLAFFIFLLSTLCSPAQDPVCRILNNINGLPSNTVYNLLQDKQGFIWIGHDKGLTRYDGRTFKNYPAPSQQGRSVSNLLSIGGQVWCQDFAGNFYFTQKDSLKKEERLQSTGTFIAAGVVNENILASIGTNTIRYLNTASGKINIFNTNNKNIAAVNYSNNLVSYVAEHTVFSFDGTKVQQQHSFSSNNIPAAFLRQIDGVYYGFTKSTYPYLHRFSNNDYIPVPVLKPGLFIQDVNVIADEIWISTSTGAYCFDKQWQPKYDGRCFFAGSSITRIVKDREGNYWFGSLDKGILVVPDINSRLYQYQAEGITALANAGENIIAGTANHRVLSFNEKDNSFTSIYKEEANHEILGLLYDEDKKQTIFYSDRIAFLDQNKKLREQLLGAKCVCVINKNLYAIAYSGGIGLVKRSNGAPVVPAWLTQPAAVWNNNIYPILSFATRGRSVAFSSRDSVLYAATTNGLLYFSPGGSGKIQYQGKDIYGSQIKSDSDGVYVATYADGLYFINERQQAIHVNNNSISKTIYKMAKCGDNIWMIGDEVLQQYNIKNNTVKNYTYADGLPIAEFKDVLVYQHKIFLATTEGLVAFDEALNNQNKTAPVLVLNDFLVNGRAVDLAANKYFQTGENNVEISFSLLSFKSSVNNELIQYKINNGDWQNLAKGSRQLNLPSLAAGSYNIQVRAFNEDGIATEKYLVFTFAIAAPFYKTGWFVVLMILAGMALVFIISMIRLRNIRQKNELVSQKIKLEQALQQSMLASIKSQMNPHFLFNALNTIQSYIYTSDKENASRYLGKFSELTRMILDMSNKEIVAVAEEIKALQLYLELEQIRFEDKLMYSLNVDENISTETSYIPSMLIQPYVENAIKHGLLHKKTDRQLLVSFVKKDTGIMVTIDDNGIGRKRSAELNKAKTKHHESFATGANEKRLQILNKGMQQHIYLEIIDKEDAGGHAAGTSVHIYIPFITR